MEFYFCSPKKVKQKLNQYLKKDTRALLLSGQAVYFIDKYDTHTIRNVCMWNLIQLIKTKFN